MSTIATSRSAFHAELLKISTVRGLRLGAALSALGLPLFSFLVVSTGGLGSADTVTSGAATGTLVALLGLGAWAATVSAGEYAQATITLSLATVPRRAVLYGAKVAAAAAVAGTAALAAAVAAFLVVLAVTPDGHDVGDAAALLAVVPAAVAVAAVGVAVGFLVRSSTGAIAVVVAALLLPKTAAGLLGGLQPYVVGASPSTVVTQVVRGGQLSTDQSFPGGSAAAVLAMLAFAAVVAVVGGVVLARRDG